MFWYLFVKPQRQNVLYIWLFSLVCFCFALLCPAVLRCALLCFALGVCCEVDEVRDRGFCLLRGLEEGSSQDWNKRYTRTVNGEPRFFVFFRAGGVCVEVYMWFLRLLGDGCGRSSLLILIVGEILSEGEGFAMTPAENRWIQCTWAERLCTAVYDNNNDDVGVAPWGGRTSDTFFAFEFGYYVK